MLEKPAIPDELILSCLDTAFGLRPSSIEFLPLGADANTAVYRVAANDETLYFLKLRKGDFDEIAALVPHFLHTHGIAPLIPPLESRAGHLWADLDPFKLILYPFVEGRSGFEINLSDRGRVDLGAALKRIHASAPPPHLLRRIPRETFSSKHRLALLRFLAQIETAGYPGENADEVGARLASFMRDRRDEIARLVERAAQLAAVLQARPADFVLCHTDLHGGNLLICPDESFYIVDWDNPLLAPKERDLMFIGGGVDDLWQDPSQISLFYQGYGPAEIDTSALAYYRFERIVEDMSVFCAELLLTSAGGADRQRSFTFFASNFLPGNTIDIAYNTDIQ